MLNERQALMKDAVPEIQEFCSKFGLQFQLVDLSWDADSDPHGITGDTAALRCAEISDCQRLSIGPHFAVS